MISFKVPGEDQLTPMVQGADTALKVIDAKGGFGGRSVKLVTCNSMLQPASAEDCAHTTLADHPVTMIGCENVWAMTGLPIYAAAKVPSLNCLNTAQDYHSPWEFGVTPGATGDDAAYAAYLCTLPAVKTAGVLVIQLPAIVSDITTAFTPILKTCGKTVSTVQVPPTATDVTPYVAKLLSYKPQYALVNLETAEVPESYAALEQGGVPASHIAGSSVYFIDTVLAHAPAMKGGISIAEWAPWSDTSDPNVVTYDNAVKAAGLDYKDPNIEWGYGLMMWLYTAAQRVGFANLDSTTLEHYLSTATNVPIPLAYNWLNPGPTQYPSIKQPFDLLAHWTGTTFEPIPVGPTKDGWISGIYPG